MDTHRLASILRDSESLSLERSMQACEDMIGVSAYRGPAFWAFRGQIFAIKVSRKTIWLVHSLRTQVNITGISTIGNRTSYCPDKNLLKTASDWELHHIPRRRNVRPGDMF